MRLCIRKLFYIASGVRCCGSTGSDDTNESMPVMGDGSTTKQMPTMMGPTVGSTTSGKSQEHKITDIFKSKPRGKNEGIPSMHKGIQSSNKPSMEKKDDKDSCGPGGCKTNENSGKDINCGPGGCKPSMEKKDNKDSCGPGGCKPNGNPGKDSNCGPGGCS